MKNFSRTKNDKLISKKELLKQLRIKNNNFIMEDIFGKCGGFPVSDEIMMEIKNFPCVETRPTGYWIRLDHDDLYKCSSCGEEENHDRRHVKYCSYCGAEMDYIERFIDKDGKEHSCG